VLCCLALCASDDLTQCHPPTDKLEDAKARAAIREQIEADKRARAEKAAREKALREGRAIPDSSATEPAKPAVASTSASGGSGVASKDYKETRLQIRMASGGQPYTTTLPSESSACVVLIFAVRRCVSDLLDVVRALFSQLTHSPFSSHL
jgi:hypothetical protein